mmetsp:Transcript_26044/g.85704  ORF Transcript_26044/g.85704 Transcript_26044/m.85704 type:complete len:211 (+) Transcript_26044:438-1070(+)
MHALSVLRLRIASLNNKTIGALDRHSVIKSSVYQIHKGPSVDRSSVTIANNSKHCLVVNRSIDIKLGTVSCFLDCHLHYGSSLELRKLGIFFRNLIRKVLDHKLLQQSNLVKGRSFCFLNNCNILCFHAFDDIFQAALYFIKQRLALSLTIRRNVLQNGIRFGRDDIQGLPRVSKNLAPPLAPDLSESFVHLHLEFSLRFSDGILWIDRK